MLRYQDISKIEKSKYSLHDFFQCILLCAWKFPSNPPQSRHPKHWHLRVYWDCSCGLAKASKGCEATWHMLWNSEMARNAGIDFLSPGDKNHRGLNLHSGEKWLVFGPRKDSMPQIQYEALHSQWIWDILYITLELACYTGVTQHVVYTTYIYTIYTLYILYNTKYTAIYL